VPSRCRDMRLGRAAYRRARAVVEAREERAYNSVSVRTRGALRQRQTIATAAQRKVYVERVVRYGWRQWQ